MIKISLLSLLAFIFLSMPYQIQNTYSPKLAVDIFPTCNSSNPASNSVVCKDINTFNGQAHKTNPIITLIKAIMEIVSFIAGAAAIILIVVSALRFITSGGDPNSVSGAKSTLFNALIGLAVTLLAQIIIVFVLDNIG